MSMDSTYSANLSRCVVYGSKKEFSIVLETIVCRVLNLMLRLDISKVFFLYYFVIDRKKNAVVTSGMDSSNPSTPQEYFRGCGG